MVRRKLEAGRVANVTALQLDLATDPRPPGHFDLVCSLMALHHVADVNALLGHFH